MDEELEAAVMRAGQQIEHQAGVPLVNEGTKGQTMNNLTEFQQRAMALAVVTKR